MATLDPQAKSLLDELAARRTPPSTALSVRGTRELIEDLLRSGEELPPVDVVRDLWIKGPTGELRVRFYSPTTEGETPVVLFFHGGGWVGGSLDSHDRLCRRLSLDADCAVLSVDYRLAPEHPFPAALRDGYAALEWLQAYGDSLGVDPDRIAVAGTSSGGNLAAATALRARDVDGPRIVHQLLIYPVTEYAFDTDSYRSYGTGHLLTRDAMRWYWDAYLDHDLDGYHPYASPLKARDLSSLPAATIVGGECDPLYSEGEAYARRLTSAGTSADHATVDGMIHAFLSFPELDARDSALDTVTTALRAAVRE